MRKLVLAIIFAFGLTACANLSKEQVVFNTWASACTAYASALIAVSPSIADGSMSDEGVAVVKEARDFIGPNCRDGVPVDGTGTLSQQIQVLLLKMQGLEVN